MPGSSRKRFLVFTCWVDIMALKTANLAPLLFRAVRLHIDSRTTARRAARRAHCCPPTPPRAPPFYNSQHLCAAPPIRNCCAFFLRRALFWLFPGAAQSVAAAASIGTVPSAARCGVSWFLVGLVGCLSAPVVRNMASKKQAMNRAFEPLKIVNTYGAFGSISKARYFVRDHTQLQMTALDWIQSRSTSRACIGLR